MTEETLNLSAKDWLDKWDKGDIVWSIEMGGLGPGYEQCIQITAAEILRHMLDRGYDAAKWSDKDQWDVDSKAIEDASLKNPIIEGLGLSGAQHWAAINLASNLYRRGCRSLDDAQVKDRLIQVSKTFP